MWRRPIKLILFFTLPISALIFISALYAPNYLNYADQPIKADAIVLFLGPDSKARYVEAERLLSDGYANYLIVPILGQVFSTSDEKPFQKKISDPAGKYPRFYEATHVEVLEAKRIISALTQAAKL